MRKTIVTSIVLVLVLLMQTVAFAASGALSAEPVSGKPGEQVQIKVRLQNPGIVATLIHVSYDGKMLRLDKAENGEIFAQSSAVFGKDTTKNPYTMMWEDSLRTDNITKSGTLCTLTFTVLPGASGKTNVMIKAEKGSTFDWELNEINVADGKAEVQIGASSAATTKAADTTKPADTTTKSPTSDTPAAKTTIASGGVPTSKDTAATKPALTKPSTTKPASTKAGADAKDAGTTRAGVTAKETTTAKPAEKTTAAAPTTAKEGAKETAAPTTKTAQTTPADTTAADVPTFPDLAPETAEQTEEFVPVFADPVPKTDVSELSTDVIIDPPAPTNGARRLLWLLLVIPVAAVVAVIVLKKKKA